MEREFQPTGKSVGTECVKRQYTGRPPNAQQNIHDYTNNAQGMCKPLAPE
jgi:hypothetical protein